MEKILIIKTGYCEMLDRESDSRRVSFGDVLRVTPLLNLYSNDHVTWVSDKRAFPLLDGNPFISRLLHYDFTTALQLESEEFDVVINLEKIPGICALSDRVQAHKGRYGFCFNAQTGESQALDHAYEVLAVSSDPRYKKSNTKTSQELLFAMVGQRWQGQDYVLGYRSNTRKLYDIGLNVITGDKWPNKAWPMHKWDNLEKRLKKDGLVVGRQDKAGQDVLNDLYKYMDWMNSCSMIITNDSLGLHLALALKKKTIGLFGPTPYKEFEFYGRGKAIYPEKEMKCMPCFQPNCTNNTFCMDEISVDEVYAEIKIQRGE